MTTLSKEASQLIFDLVGDYETEKRHWHTYYPGTNMLRWFVSEVDPMDRVNENIPAPSFGETIRILPKIGEKKEWKWVEFNGLEDHFVTLCKIYAFAPTEELAMQQISEEIIKLLK